MMGDSWYERRISNEEMKAKEYLLNNINLLEIIVDKDMSVYYQNIAKSEMTDYLILSGLGKVTENYVAIYSKSGEKYVIPLSKVKFIKVKSLQRLEHNALVYANYCDECRYIDEDGKPI